MQLRVLRYDYTARRTMGLLLVDGRFRGYVLEDPMRAPGVKVAGETCIPPGAYHLTLYPSPRFRMIVPLLHDVPGFDMVELHAGNTAEDTSGCLLVGTFRQDDTVAQSMGTLLQLVKDLQAAQGRGEALAVTVEAIPVPALPASTMPPPPGATQTA